MKLSSATAKKMASKEENLGRIEQFDENNNSKWKVIEEEWLYLYNNKSLSTESRQRQLLTENLNGSAKHI